VIAQELNSWNILSEVTFESKPSKQSDFLMDTPTFSKRVWSYQNKKIQLKGYLIPFGELGDKSKYMLSSFPFSSCFFCGSAGPETVVEIQTNQILKPSNNQIRMEGILVLNDKDPDHHIYILKDIKLLD
jgi:hypothetical protein